MTTRADRNELNSKLLELLQCSKNTVIDHELETDDEWGFIECVNEQGQEVKIVFTEEETVAVYVDGVQVKCGGGD